MDGHGNWPPEFHRAFVEAIMAQGIERASPAVIQKEMTLNTQAVTTERIKSKLQKYRSAKQKSLAQFMKEYDESAANTGTLTQATVSGEITPQNSKCGPHFGAGHTTHPLGGDVAALLTRAVISEEQTKAKAMKFCGLEEYETIEGSFDHRDGSLRIAFPYLSEDEKESGIGKALSHVWGILGALGEQRPHDFSTKSQTINAENHATTILKQPGSSDISAANSYQYPHELHSQSYHLNQKQQDQTFVSPHSSFENAHGIADDDSPGNVDPILSDAALLGVLESIDEETPWGANGGDCDFLDGNVRGNFP